ncbi:MAG: GDP-mannose 4,6-dehydratase, partial [Pseudomonadota bacterium]
IATGLQMSVRDFVVIAARELGIELAFSGEGVNEIGIVASLDNHSAPAIKKGDIIVRVDKRYFRPAEVETLLGDASKAKAELGWVPEISVEEMCAEMVREDLLSARKALLLAEQIAE